MNIFPLSKSLTLLFLFIATSNVAFGSEQTESECDPSAFRVSKLITVSSSFSFDKKKSNICFEKDGGFHVRTGGTLNLKDLKITLTKNSPTVESNGFIKLEPGSTLKLNRVKIISKYNVKIQETKDNTSGALGITGSINIIKGSTSEKLGVRLEVFDTQLISENLFSTGGISIRSFRRSAKPVTGWIMNSEFDSVWTPILVLNANQFKINNNNFKKSPGSNIVVSGSNVTIDNNNIIFPGNGYIGDGITVYESLKNSRIINNNISGGSCYGIWFYNAEFHNILVSQNLISSGVTNGINISNDKKLKNKNLLITENHFTGNAGFGVGIDKDVSGVTLSSNYFIGNARLFGNNDISISNTASAIIDGKNISAEAIDTEWAKTRDPFRTHVNKSLNILRY
jgi:hypothetical protein